MGLCIKEMLIGADPFKIGELWKDVPGHRDERAARHGDPAMSAVDMALWDLCGKAVGQPVHQAARAPPARGSRPMPRCSRRDTEFENTATRSAPRPKAKAMGFKAMKTEITMSRRMPMAA